MKPRKDGRYLNCYITRTLLEEFEIVCDIQGRTKTGVLEEAMQKAIDPFYSYGADGSKIPVLDPCDGIVELPHPKHPERTKLYRCTILDEKLMMGVPSYKIWVNGQLMTVPKDIVKKVS